MLVRDIRISGSNYFYGGDRDKKGQTRKKKKAWAGRRSGPRLPGSCAGGPGPDTQLANLLACAVIMGMALTFTTIGAMIADRTPPAAGTAMGLCNSCIYLGIMAGSTVMGSALKRVGYPAAFAAAGCVKLVALLLFLLMMREKKFI